MYDYSFIHAGIKYHQEHICLKMMAWVQYNMIEL